MDIFLNIQKVIDKNAKYSEFEKIYADKSLLKKIILEVIPSDFFTNKINNRTILLKPNWVNDIRKKEHHYCLITNENFIIAFVELLLEYKPKKLIIGDAPIQLCRWSNLYSKDFENQIVNLSKLNNIVIELIDFRRTVWAEKNYQTEKVPLTEYIIFDLGHESKLDEISSTKSKFRVTNYDPKKLEETHSFGMHKYCITKHLFEADIVISLPKIKTHQKAGITNALKILVGLNGDKDFLPHHRIGGTEMGGDCYPGKSKVYFLAERMLDWVNRFIGTKLYGILIKLPYYIWKIKPKSQFHSLSAGWYGNDTVWRMVYDLNTIALYGDKNGLIHKEPQREIYSLCDAIIGGQGDGPLNPEPLPLGYIAFSNNAIIMDIAFTKIMGFDINKIPLLREMILKLEHSDYEINLDKRKVKLEDLKLISVNAKPSPGWVGQIELNN